MNQDIHSKEFSIKLKRVTQSDLNRSYGNELQDTSSSVAIHLNQENDLSNVLSTSYCLDMSRYSSDPLNGIQQAYQDYTDVLKLDSYEIESKIAKKLTPPHTPNTQPYHIQQDEPAIPSLPGLVHANSDLQGADSGPIDQDIVVNLPNASMTSGDSIAQNNFNQGQRHTSIDPEELYRIEFGMPEAKLYLRKAILFYIAMIITSASMLSDSRSITYFQILLLGPTFYCISFIVMELQRTRKVVGGLWLKSGDIFKTFDAFNFLILVIAIQLRIYEIIPRCIHAVGPFILGAVGYLAYCKDTMRVNAPLILARYYYVIQATFILLRFDGYSECSWALVLLPTWIYPGIELFEFLNFMITILYRICTKRYPRCSTKLVGLVWHIGYKGMVFAGLMTMFGFLQDINATIKDINLVATVSLIFMAVNIILLAMTLVGENRLLAFLLILPAIESRVLEYGPHSLESKEGNQTVSFEVSKRTEFFVMHSPTWFLRLYDSIYVRGGGLEHNGSFISVRDTKDTDDISFMEDNRPTVSLDDLDWVTEKREREKLQQKKSEPTNSQDEKLCYICCVNPSNAAMTYCGHGGICFECGITHLRQSTQCMQCREEVESIVKIDPTPVFDDIVKVTERHILIVNGK